VKYEVEGARPKGRPQLNREDAMDDNRWRKQIRDD